MLEIQSFIAGKGGMLYKGRYDVIAQCGERDGRMIQLLGQWLRQYADALALCPGFDPEMMAKGE